MLALSFKLMGCVYGRWGGVAYPESVVTIVVGPVGAVAVPVLLPPPPPVGETNVAVVGGAIEVSVLRVRVGSETTGMVMVPSSVPVLAAVAVVSSGGKLTTGKEMGSSPSPAPSVAVGSTGREMTPSSPLYRVSRVVLVREWRQGEATFVCSGRRHWRRPEWPWKGQRIAYWQVFDCLVHPGSTMGKEETESAVGGDGLVWILNSTTNRDAASWGRFSSVGSSGASEWSPGHNDTRRRHKRNEMFKKLDPRLQPEHRSLPRIPSRNSSCAGPKRPSHVKVP